MKKALYFTLKPLSVLEIFKFLVWLFGHVGKRPDKKAEINFKIYDVKNSITITMHILPVKAIRQ